MDLLAQELIDEIIDDLPHPSLHSCSLVARRWRRRSQERAFARVEFSSEYDLLLWCTNIPQGPYGIPSYVRSADIGGISSWHDPTLFGRVLEKFTSMTALWINHVKIPRLDKLPGSVSFGEFGKKVEYLALSSPQCTVATIMSLVLSFPNLKDFFLTGGVSRRRSTILPHASQRRALVSVSLQPYIEGGVGTALAQCGVTARKLSMPVYSTGREQLLTLSSEVIAELELFEQYPPYSPHERPMSLPSFPALATVKVAFRTSGPCPGLAYILSSIHSAPVLTTITFTSWEWHCNKYTPSDSWVSIDKWLARMAMQVKVKGSLVATLRTRWPESAQIWGMYLPGFRKAGGEVRVGTAGAAD